MSSCPTCNKPVDPLRSRAVAVREGKIIAYCSKECLAKGQAEYAARTASGAPAPTPVAAPAAPAKPQTPSTGVPVRLVTPVAGVPVQASAGIPRPKTPPAGVPASLESGPVIEILHEPASGVVTSAKDERLPESAKVDKGTGPRAKHPDEISIAQFWEREKSEPVKMPPAKKADDTVAKWAIGDDTAIRKYGNERATSEDEALPAKKSRAGLVILVLLLLGAGGFFVYQYLAKQNVSAATDSPPATQPAPPVEPPKPAAAPAPEKPAVDVAGAVDRARTILHGYVKTSSPRIQRVAAKALARTGDKEARDVLADQLAAEPSDIAKLDIAYALARAGDKRGMDALVAALRSERGEARDEAARQLCRLGDPRGIPHLTDVLDVPQRRLGAAVSLAHVAEPKALKALDAIIADAKASPDEKARATIALGFAGRSDVAPALHGMLTDPHFNVFAAAALAHLKDAAAKPVLEKQLEFPTLRVGAARALRELEPALDPAPLIPPLASELSSGKDLEQVQAAEAILLLGGPAAWAAHE